MDFRELFAIFLLLLSAAIVHGLLQHSLDGLHPCLAGDIVGRDLNIHAAMERAKEVHLVASSIDPGKLDVDPRARTAWDDCLVLAEDTIHHLHRLMASPSSHHSRTWLSAAIANQQTCLDGFRDFNLNVPSFSSLFTNMSQTLSNALAIDEQASLPISEHGDTFPEWAAAADRELYQSTSTMGADLVVAKDGSGNYTTINGAVEAAKSMRSRGDGKRIVIHVKAGVYGENVEITKSMTNITFVGDGKNRTVVTGSRNVVDGSTTFRSATFATVGAGFIARDMTFENTAGPEKQQAVALRSGADLSVFYRCSFKGYQDTLYVHSQRQFYRECDVYGTVDFIFGDAVAVLQDCNIYVRRPMKKQKNTVTAQGRSDPNENTGISIHNSTITAAPDLRPVQGSFETFLGRPWKEYSRTVFMKSTLDGLVAPAGWLEWDGNFALDTLYYGEYMNTGAGAGTSGRVKWPGYRVIVNASEAGRFTVANFLAGDSWLPATGVPFTSGL